MSNTPFVTAQLAATQAPLPQSVGQQRLPSAYRDEALVLAAAKAAIGQGLNWQHVQDRARPWIEAVRNNPPPFWAMESLLKEYPISSNEGLALMRLAEALLRVPDTATAIALTADQLGRADFDAHGDSAMSRVSANAIALSKHFLPVAAPANAPANTLTNPLSSSQAEPNLLTKLGAKTVVAATVRAVQLMGKQFVLGQTIEEAISIGAKSGPQLRYSFDMLGEGARTHDDAQRYLASYQHAIAQIAQSAISSTTSSSAVQTNNGISIKLSALHPRYEFAQKERVMAELVPIVLDLCSRAARANINLTLDAEEVDRLEISLDILETAGAYIAKHYPLWQGFGLALQAYQTRALDLIEVVANMAQRHGIKLMCRLVKGAYWDAEVKRAQELGLPHYPVFTHKEHTDVSYLACAQALLKHQAVIYPQFATHNACTIAAIFSMAEKNNAQFELQRLHGMGEGVYREVLRDSRVQCRVYAPVGAHKDLLAYLVRRLLENGANSSFVHKLASDDVPIHELLVSPLEHTKAPTLPLPPDLYGTQRLNSMGLDLTEPAQLQPLLNAANALSEQQLAQLTPALYNPSEAQATLARAQSAFGSWANQSVETRANILMSAADQLQKELPHFCALLVKEAFKTWADAVSEVREAIDFLRYYALEAQTLMAPLNLPGPTGESNVLQCKPRGVWLCISPWNFPLAIFVGQVSAALVTGNAVIAKPAEQTPAVAQAAVDLLHRCGVPSDALQLCHGAGETVGAALVALPNIAGVVFTGSTAVAKIINRNLAAKDGPITALIAETGGINAMLVDSTALPEQVCDAVMQSAFRSAGQRCSALRLLCVHEAVAEPVIAMIRGAMKELQTGDSVLLAKDVPRVIDDEAFNTIQSQIQQIKAIANSVSAQPKEPCVVQPTLVEIKDVAQCKQEIFGPVLQVMRYAGDPHEVVNAINRLGYGLTLGIQTRIDSRALSLANAALIGNVYVNRNMVGAVVGVQPFGGQGLSGTGPKAGGPHYLARFCTEQTLTINTAAAGGNAALLAASQ